MKKLINILVLLLFISGAATAQKYYMSKKGFKQYVYEKNESIIKNTLESYGFKYNEKDDLYECEYLSWFHQYYIKRLNENMVVIVYYATPNTKYIDRKKINKKFSAFHTLIKDNLEMGYLKPTVPSELYGWAAKYKIN
jgi:hypothetical protein